MRVFFDPSPEDQNVVLVGSRILYEAEKLIAGCEGCSRQKSGRDGLHSQRAGEVSDNAGGRSLRSRHGGRAPFLFRPSSYSQAGKSIGSWFRHKPITP